MYDANDNLIGLLDKQEDAAFVCGLADLLEQAWGDNQRLRTENAQLRRQLGLS